MTYLSLFEVPGIDNTRATANQNVNGPFQQGHASFCLGQTGIVSCQILNPAFNGGMFAVEICSGLGKVTALVRHTMT